MRAAAIAGPGRVTVTAGSGRRPGPGELRGRVEACGICGSDGMFVSRGGIPETTPFGHEVVVEVVEAGPGAEAGWLGRRVVLLPFGTCEACAHCVRGETTRCPDRFGHFRSGFADEVHFAAAAAPSWCIVPEGVDSATATLLEPLSVAVRAVRQAGVLTASRSERVLVAGAGAIGVLVARLLLRAGFADVTVVERNPDKFALLREMLPGALLRHELPDVPASFVFECSGTAAVLDHAVVRGVEPGGTICLVAAYGKAPELNALMLMAREVRMVGTFSAAAEDAHEAAEILFAEASVLAALVTETASLAGIGNAFERVAGGRVLGRCVILPGDG